MDYVFYSTLCFISWTFYWFYRLHPKIKLLWYVHEVYHQGEHLGLIDKSLAVLD